MKKISGILLCLLVFAVTASAQEQTDETGSFTYRNVTILKVLNNDAAYVVMYYKGSTGYGQTVIPKTWFHTSERKATLRTLPKNLNPYMTVMYKNGEFDHVILTLPRSRNESVWGILPYGTDISSWLDAETLDMTY